MQDEYAELKGILSNIRTLRKAMKGVDPDLLNEYVEKLTVVRDEITEEYKQYDKQLIEKNDAINKARAYLEGANLPVPDQLRKEFTLSDLLGFEKSTKRKNQRKAPASEVKPKFALQHSDGSWLLWAGRGRTPTWFTNAKESGTEVSELEANAAEYNSGNV